VIRRGRPRRRPRLAALAVLLGLLAPGPARAGELTAEEAKWARDLVKALGANSPRVRKSAEDALVGLGLDALPVVLDAMALARGEAASQGLRRVLEGMGRAEVVAALERMRQGMPRSQARRIDVLLAELQGSVAPGVPTALDLVPATLDAPELAPLAAEAPIEGRLPAALVRAAHLAREEGGALLLDTDGDGTPDLRIPPGEASVLVLGGPGGRAPILVYAKRGVWFACSAALLRATAGKVSIEFLDADLDGRFDGEADFVRVGAGAFGLLHPSRRLLVEETVVDFDLARDAENASIAFAPLRRSSGLDDAALRGALALNRLRAELGLAPVLPDAARSAACLDHARYLAANAGSAETEGLGSHRQVPGRPGYSERGAEAGASSAISGSADPVRAVASFASTMLHRRLMLGDASFDVGIGSLAAGRGSSTVLWGADPTRTGAAPLVVPAPGQRRVPLRGGGEMPPPDDPPDWYAQPRGYPVSAHYPGRALAGVDLQLFLADGSTLVPGRLWTHERPVTLGHGGASAFFMPAAPLEPRRAYAAVLTATESGRSRRWIWTFRTD
jgi:hypothetical protein